MPQKRQPFNFRRKQRNEYLFRMRALQCGGMETKKIVVFLNLFRRCSQEGAPKKKTQSIFFELFFPYNPLLEFSQCSRFIFVAHSPSVSSVFCFSVLPLPLLPCFYVHSPSHIHFLALPDCHCHERHHHCHPEFGFHSTRFLYRSEPVGRDYITSQCPHNAI